jgi:hypothetical protein
VTHPRRPGVFGSGGRTMLEKTWEDWFIIIGTLAGVVALGNFC